MQIRSAVLRNFRCYRDVSFAFSHEPSDGSESQLGNVTLLLGNNGAGKSSILKALAVGVLAPILPSSGFTPAYLLRRTRRGKAAANGSISLDLCLDPVDFLYPDPAATTPAKSTWGTKCTLVAEGDYEEIRRFESGGTVSPSRDGIRDWHRSRLVDDDSPGMFLLAYGATRRVESIESLDSNARKKRRLRYSRVAGLFEDYVSLFPLSAWVPNLADDRFLEVAGILKKICAGGPRLTRGVERGECLFLENGVRLPFSALSDGYRMMIGLVGDILYHLHLTHRDDSPLKTRTGTVIIDDVDMHLHPAWQKRVLPDLAAAFPSLQFIVTSHSPLVASSVHRQNVRLIEDGEVKELDEHLFGKTADQILTSDYFGLDMPRSANGSRAIESAASEVAETRDPEAAIRFLKTLTFGPAEVNS